MFLIIDTEVNKSEESRFVFKRIFNEKLLSVDWSGVLKNMDPNSAYDDFSRTFLLHYNAFFPIKRIQIKTKNLTSPWITRGIIKSSKRNQKLYEKYLRRKDSKKRRYL